MCEDECVRSAQLAGLLAATFAVSTAAEYISICPAEKDPRADQDVFLVEGPRGVKRFIDITGKVVLESTAIVGYFYEGLARATEGNRYGFVDRGGQWQISPQFQEVGDFSEGRAPVKIDGKWGYIDLSGAAEIPAAFDGGGEFHDDRAAVRIGDLYGYIDRTGQLVIPAVFGVARDFSEGRAWAVMGARPCWIRSEAFSLYDASRSVPYFLGDRPFPYRFSIPNCRYVLLSRDGEIVSEVDYDDVRDFSEGLAAVAQYSELAWSSPIWANVL